MLAEAPAKSPPPVIRGKVDLRALGVEVLTPTAETTSESVIARRRRTHLALWVGFAAVAVGATVALLLAGTPTAQVRVQVLAAPATPSH